MSKNALKMIEDYILKINLSNDNYHVIIDEKTFNKLVNKLEEEESYEDCKKLIDKKDKIVMEQK